MTALIPTPCNQEVEKYLELWDSNDKFVLQEKSINKLFTEIFTDNTDIEHVLIKASVLNDFYSTNIFSIYDMAKHIVSLDIDERLKQGDEALVSEIGHIVIADKEKYFYSFATKYCSHHNPVSFPIYDSYVDKVLMYFKKKDKFAVYKQDDLKVYPIYKKILSQFSEFYGITSFSLKELDMYLWQLGKKFFSEKTTLPTGFFKDGEKGLQAIKNPKYETSDPDDFEDGINPYIDADVFIHGSCQLFAFALHNKYKYTGLNLQTESNENAHYFCKANYMGKDVYIDVRGITANLNDVISQFIYREKYEIVEYDFRNEKVLSKEEAHGLEFAEHIINIHPNFYNINDLGGAL